MNQLHPNKVHKVEEIFATPWFELVAKSVGLQGAPFYSLKLPDYVCVVPVTAAGEFLLVRQYRPAVEALTLEWPSGLLEPQETPLDAAKRELWEETGYRGDDWISLGAPIFTDTGRLNNRIHYFFARGLEPSVYTREEEVEPLLLPWPQLQKEISEGSFGMALHLAPLFLVAQGGHWKF